MLLFGLILASAGPAHAQEAPAPEGKVLFGVEPAEAGWTGRAAAFPPSAGEALQAALQPWRLDGLVSDGWIWTDLTIDRHEARFVVRKGGDAASVRLRAPGLAPGSAPAAQLATESTSPSGERVARLLAAKLREAEAQGAFSGLWRSVAVGNTSPRGGAQHERVLLVGMVALWALFFLLFAWRAWRTWREAEAPARRFVLGAGLTFVVAGGALRLALATWGPGDLHMNMWRLFAGDGIDFWYGAGPDGLFRPLFALFGPSLSLLYGVLFLAGAFVPVLAVLLVRAIDGSRRFALVAGGLTAAHPLLIRFSGEANRQSLVLFVSLVALWGFARLVRTRSPFDVALGTVALALAAFTRLEAVLLIPAAFALVLTGAWGRERGRTVLAAATVAMTVVGLAWLLLRPFIGRAGLVTGVHLPDLVFVPRLFGTVWTAPLYNPPLLAVLALGGLLVGLVRRDRVALWLAPSLYLLSIIHNQFIVSAGQFESARYHSLSLLLALLAAAYAWDGLVSLLRRRGDRLVEIGATALLVATLVATGWPAARHVLQRRTVDDEWRFLRTNAPALPEAGVVYTLPIPGDVGLKGHTEMLPHVFGGGAPWRHLENEAGPPEARAVFYLPGFCASRAGARLSPEGAERCRRALGRYGCHPLVTARLPAVEADEEDYADDFVPVGFYDMTGAPCVEP